MLVNFKDRFVIPIELGTKRQTIRRPRKGLDFRKGDLIHMSRGDRFHPVRIGLARVLDVQTVALDFAADTVAVHQPQVLDAIWLKLSGAAELDFFAVMDGFTDWADLRRFWADTHPGESYRGNRIFWGDTFAGPLDPTPAELA